MNGSPSVKVALFIRNGGSESCRTVIFIIANESAEENRKIILQKLAQLEPKIKAGTKLAELCRYCPAETAKRLSQLHAKLNQVTNEVSAIRDANRVLVSAALSAVNYHLNVLGDTAVAPVYGAGGSENVSKSKKFDFEA